MFFALALESSTFSALTLENALFTQRHKCPISYAHRVFHFAVMLEITITGTMYNFESSDVILEGFETDEDPRRNVIEAIADQAENWAVNSNGYIVRHLNII